MTEKYSGCNIVESVVSGEVRTSSAQKKKSGASRFKLFLLRIAIAAVMVCGVLALHYLPAAPALSRTRGVLHDVFCYDVFGRTVFGYTV